MTLKLAAQRQNLRDLLVCGELTPPRSDSSEPSLSPAPAPMSPPSPSSVKDDPDTLHNLHPVPTSSTGGMRDHTRLTLCGFMLLFLAFNPLGILVNNIGRFNYDYVNTKLDGRTILNYQGKLRGLFSAHDLDEIFIPPLILFALFRLQISWNRTSNRGATLSFGLPI